MPLDPHARRFLDRLAAVAPRASGSLSIDERRDALAQLLGIAALTEAVGAVADRTIPGPDGEPLAVRAYTPRQGEGGSLPGLVYFHGGGLVAGSIDSHDAICRSLANASGHCVMSVDYRLAPESPFPAAVLDACAATRWILAHAGDFAVDARRIGVCGDSAGATLAAVACQVLAGEHGPRPAFQLLLCPILDHVGETPSRAEFGQGYFLDRGTLEHDLRHYLGDMRDTADPRLSPLRAPSLKALPPTCIHTAEFDPLRDEAEEYARRLREAGVPTSYRCHSGMIHLFYGMGALIPYGAAAYQQVAADLRALLSRPAEVA